MIMMMTVTMPSLIPDPPPTLPVAFTHSHCIALDFPLPLFLFAVMYIIIFVLIINDGAFCGKYDRYIAWSDSSVPSQLCRAHLSSEFYRARERGRASESQGR